MISRILGFLARKVSGKLADESQSTTHPIAMLDIDEDPGELPMGTPVVTFSARALEMLEAPARLRAPKETKKEPVPGSLEWRIAQLKKVPRL